MPRRGLHQDWLGGPRLVSDVEPLSPGRVHPRGQSRGRNALAARHLLDPVQPHSQRARSPFPRRYESLLVDPDGGLCPLYHYIHLNLVRAKLRPVRTCLITRGPACLGCSTRRVGPAGIGPSPPWTMPENSSTRRSDAPNTSSALLGSLRTNRPAKRNASPKCPRAGSLGRPTSPRA